MTRLTLTRHEEDDQPLHLDGVRVDLTNPRGGTTVVGTSMWTTVVLATLTTDQLLALAQLALAIARDRVLRGFHDPGPG